MFQVTPEYILLIHKEKVEAIEAEIEFNRIARAQAAGFPSEWVTKVVREKIFRRKPKATSKALPSM